MWRNHDHRRGVEYVTGKQERWREQKTERRTEGATTQGGQNHVPCDARTPEEFTQHRVQKCLKFGGGSFGIWKDALTFDRGNAPAVALLHRSNECMKFPILREDEKRVISLEDNASEVI